MPQTSYGKWSVRSLLVMFGLFGISSSLKNYINRSVLDGDTVYAIGIIQSILEILIRGAFAAGLSALVNGLIGIFSEKDRGVLLHISTVLGAVATVLFIVLFFFP